ncbi:MAG: 1-acyl-sn-glycerol-3-phosphate acyltransferase [Spirochaetes bacterium]|nr:1-acyl-sn-glycerol-3-phosphate acyltransferase [Spirochaetota bacterium]
MIKTILIFTYFWLFLLLTTVGLAFWLLLFLLGLTDLRTRFTQGIVQFWARHFLWVVGAKVQVEGVDRIPKEGRLCFISNHQSALDILCILGYSGRTPGFIAKRELVWAPILNLWMLVIHCVFIERKNPKKAIRAIEKGVEHVRRGYPMVIFPEGTRSRDGKVHEFKPGSLKLATRSNAIVIPVTIQGTWEVYEKSGRFQPGTVRIVFHPPINTALLSQEERRLLPGVVQKIVESGFL